MGYVSVYYQRDNGEEPVRDFIDSLNYKIQQRFFAREEQLLGAYGEKLPPPHAHHLGGGLYELKVDFGNLAYRFFYFLLGTTVIHIHAIQKKTQKVPPRDIELAISRRKHFYQQIERGELEL